MSMTGIGVSSAILGEAEEKWVALFDGKTLNGWTRRGGVATYRVEDGAIVGTTIPGKEVNGKMESGTDSVSQKATRYG